MRTVCRLPITQTRSTMHWHLMGYTCLDLLFSSWLEMCKFKSTRTVNQIKKTIACRVQEKPVFWLNLSNCTYACHARISLKKQFDIRDYIFLTLRFVNQNVHLSCVCWCLIKRQETHCYGVLANSPSLYNNKQRWDCVHKQDINDMNWLNQWVSYLSKVFKRRVKTLESNT